MTTFRSELRSARRAYRAARYPGDLAADVPHQHLTRAVPPRRRAGLFALGAVAAAAAAVVLVARLPVAHLARPSAAPRPLHGVAQRPTLPDYPVAAARTGFVPAVSLGAFPTRPAGVAPAVGRLTPPALPGGRIIPALDNCNDPARAIPADKPSTQESV